MKIQLKILITCLIPVLVFIGTLGIISHATMRQSLFMNSRQWMDTRLNDAIAVVQKHNTMLRQYGLENIKASVAKAKLDAIKEIASITIKQKGYVFVADAQGVIVYHPDKYYVGTDASSDNWFIDLSQGKKLSIPFIKDKPYLFSHHFNKSWNWHLIAVDPAEDALKPLEDFRWFLILAGVIVITVFSLFLYYLVGRSLSGLPEISKSVKKIASGLFDSPLDLKTSDELGILGHDINHMAAYMKKQFEHLHDQIEYYHALARHAIDLVVVCNEQGKITYVSPSVKQITGFTFDEMVGHPFSDFIDPDHHNSLKEHFRVTGLSKLPVPPIELRLKHNDGRFCTLETKTKDLRRNKAINGFLSFSRNIDRRLSFQNNLSRSHKALQKDHKTILDNFEQATGQIELLHTEQARIESEFDKNYQSAVHSFSDIGREISTSLTAVLDSTRNLMESCDETTTKESLTSIYQSCRHLLITSMDMTLLSAIFSNKLMIEPEKTDLKNCIDSVIDDFKLRIIDKPLQLINDACPDLPEYVFLDQRLFEKSLYALLDLANQHTVSGRIKFTYKVKSPGSNGQSELNITIEQHPSDMPDKVLNRLTDFCAGAPVNKTCLIPPGISIPFFNCCRIIDEMNGRLAIIQADKNTVCFDLSLPGL